ncbi:MAG TPA: NAD(P)-dependent oxidoreductase [Candidatus Binataceae bacterium]|nr:NAD(P)-dependent oxidoreductase [Candidatus Binataceae bacterium]
MTIWNDHASDVNLLADRVKDTEVLVPIRQLNDATRGIVTLADLSRMEPTALIVNTSRAGWLR